MPMTKREHDIKYNKSHSEQIKLMYRRNKLTLKILIFQVYSEGTMRCKYCGYDNIDALSIDHIKNDGEKQRNKLHLEGSGFYAWLRRNRFPSGYQVLCMNCQLLKRINRFSINPLLVEGVK